MFTLIGILVSTVIMSVTGLVTAQIYQNHNKILYKNHLLTTQQYLVNDINIITTAAGTIIEDSMKLNTHLKNCLEQGGVCKGQKNISNLQLILPDGNKLINGESGAFFSHTGAPCTSWSNLCPFKKTLTITPFCPENNNECEIAEGLLFRFNIKIYPDIKEEYTLSENKKEIYISTKTLLQNNNNKAANAKRCPPGQIITQLNTDGSITCNNQKPNIHKTVIHNITTQTWEIKTSNINLSDPKVQNTIEKLRNEESIESDDQYDIVIN